MPFVKGVGGGGREGESRGGGEKRGREGEREQQEEEEEERGDGLSCKGARISRFNPCSEGEKDKNPDSFNHHCHHSAVTAREKKSMIDSI